MKHIEKQRKWKKPLLLFGISLAAVGLLVLLLAEVYGPFVRHVQEPEKFRAWVDSHGIWGRLCFSAAVILQVVVAILPGEPFEIAAGYAFGALEGTALCLLSATIGSVLVFLLVRRFGAKIVGLFFSGDQVRQIGFLKTNPRRTLLFIIIYMIPGTPKDLLCYFAGMTDIAFPTWLIICSFGRIPSVIMSTVGGDALGTSNYWFSLGVFLASMGVSLGGLAAYDFICKRHKK